MGGEREGRDRFVRRFSLWLKKKSSTAASGSINNTNDNKDEYILLLYYFLVCYNININLCT